MKKLIAFFVVAALLVMPFSQISVSAQTFPSDEQQEIDKISEELQFYFEEIGEFDENDNYHIKNLELLKERVDAGDPTAKKVYEIYSETSDTTPGEIAPMSATSFAKCIVGKFKDSYGSIARAFLTGAIFTYIKNKEWDLAARLMFKTLKAAGFKVNIAGLAIEAGIYGWQCRGKF